MTQGIVGTIQSLGHLPGDYYGRPPKPYVKLSMGDSTWTSEPNQTGNNVELQKNYQLPIPKNMLGQKQIMKVQVCDDNFGAPSNQIGVVEIETTNLEKNKTYPIHLNLYGSVSEICLTVEKKETPERRPSKPVSQASKTLGVGDLPPKYTPSKEGSRMSHVDAAPSECMSQVKPASQLSQQNKKRQHQPPNTHRSQKSNKPASVTATDYKLEGTVHCVVDIPVDFNGEAPNPYVVVTLDGDALSSAEKQNTLNPLYEEEFSFYPLKPSDPETPYVLRADVLDGRYSEPNNAIGYVEIDISALKEAKIYPIDIPLNKAEPARIQLSIMKTRGKTSYSTAGSVVQTERSEAPSKTAGKKAPMDFTGTKIDPLLVERGMRYVEDCDWQDVSECILRNNGDLTQAVDSILDGKFSRAMRRLPAQKARELQGPVIDAKEGSVKGGKNETYFSFNDPEGLFTPQYQGLKKVDASPGKVPPTGNKKALLIGVNYLNTSAEVRSCVPDVNRVKNMLSRVYKFPTNEENMTILTDDKMDQRLKPTRANIIRGLHWLKKGAKKGDTLFLLFAGHGAQIPAKKNNWWEKESRISCVLPEDWQESGILTDTDIHNHLMASLDDGVKLTGLFDCCHTGAALDLPYKFDIMSRGWVEDEEPVKSCGDVVLFSGTKDYPGANDIQHSEPAGAITSAFLNAVARQVESEPDVSYSKFFENMAMFLKRNRFPQQPQLYATQTLHPEDKFNLTAVHANGEPEVGCPVSRNQPAPVTKIPSHNCCGCGGGQDWHDFVLHQIVG